MQELAVDAVEDDEDDEEDDDELDEDDDELDEDVEPEPPPQPANMMITQATERLICLRRVDIR